MSGTLFLLDTNVLLALIRGRGLGFYIDAHFGLRHSRQRPLVSIVSHGEIWVLARRCNWGQDRREALQAMLGNLVPVQLDHPGVVDAYVHLDLCSHEHPQGARNMGKNDLWIAATAHASGATLLTTDQDFAHLVPNQIEGVIIDPRPPR